MLGAAGVADADGVVVGSLPLRCVWSARSVGSVVGVADWVSWVDGGRSAAVPGGASRNGMVASDPSTTPVTTAVTTGHGFTAADLSVRSHPA